MAYDMSNEKIIKIVQVYLGIMVLTYLITLVLSIRILGSESEKWSPDGRTVNHK